MRKPSERRRFLAQVLPVVFYGHKAAEPLGDRFHHWLRQKTSITIRAREYVSEGSHIPLLLEHPMTVTEISRFAEQPGRDTAEDLEHLIKSLKHTEYQAVIEPATCRKCGFEFSTDKLRKPSKCPKCKSTWVTEPRVSVTRR